MADNRPTETDKFGRWLRGLNFSVVPALVARTG